MASWAVEEIEKRLVDAFMKITNSRARHDYNVLEAFEAGISLSGPEVKSVRGGRMTLSGSFVKIIGNEVYLVNAQIFPYSFARPPSGGYDSKRTRKLLLHKREIIALKTKTKGKGLTIIPLECYNRNRFIKLKIGLVKGKKKYEKKEKIKRRDIKRDIERELKGNKSV